MRLFVYTLNTTLFEGSVDKVTLPAESGQVTVLPGHEPFVMTLVSGMLVSTEEEGEAQKFEIEGGLARVDQGAVVVLAH